MNQDELKQKLDASAEKVEKRLKNIKKLCSQLKINAEDILKTYNEFKNSSAHKKDTYLSSVDAGNIVYTYCSVLEERDSNGNFNDDAYEYNRKVDSLADNLSKLFDVELTYNNWETKYNIYVNKMSAPKIEVLWNFLNDWEAKAKDWFLNNKDLYLDCANEYHKIAYDYYTKNAKDVIIDYMSAKELRKNFCEYMLNTHNIRAQYYRYGDFVIDDYVNNCNVDTFTKLITVLSFVSEEDAEKYGSVARAIGRDATKGHYVIKSFNEKKLTDDLYNEKLRKYDDLCNRISDIVGEIQDVSDLTIGAQNGELNGIVKGTKGSCRVETISAGGYNIQCFHYRVLVHKIN